MIISTPRFPPLTQRPPKCSLLTLHIASLFDNSPSPISTARICTHMRPSTELLTNSHTLKEVIPFSFLPHPSLFSPPNPFIFDLFAMVWI